ncbi:MAG: GNAT family N-acetyltransferase, partial [Candidatus Helarchaeota archaeon]|nr:GNAT family N-acetyltransferase [Candidatus Helarchaeota archaeon]
PEWIHITASDRNVVWKVVRDTLTDNVIGMGTIIMDPKNQRGYVRGFMVDPDYQSYGVGGWLALNAFQEFAIKYRDVIKIIWTENRTAHAKSQKISEAAGMRPVGLFPNKDIFLTKRESDVLFALYAMNALKMRRPEPALIPAVMPIFRVVGHQFRLGDAVPTQVPRTHADGYAVQGFISVDKYNYRYCTYRANGRELKFMINPRTRVAEKTWFSPDIDPVTLKTLLRSARISLNPKIYYMECYVSAFQPAIQQVFIDLGYVPTGYIPGWDLVDGKREDRIIMTWVREIPPLVSMQLTRRAMKIAKLFLS